MASTATHSHASVWHSLFRCDGTLPTQTYEIRLIDIMRRSSGTAPLILDHGTRCSFTTWQLYLPWEKAPGGWPKSTTGPNVLGRQEKNHSPLSGIEPRYLIRKVVWMRDPASMNVRNYQQISYSKPMAVCKKLLPIQHNVRAGEELINLEVCKPVHHTFK
jgi:hypothetical protein